MIDLNELTPFELDEPETRSNDVHKKAQAILRAKRLARPITAKQIAHFEKYLRPVCCGPYECWVHTGKNMATDKHGRGTYVRVKHNGELVFAHRLAFCISTGTTFAEIQGYHIAHVNTCVGYRCCRPDHLFRGRKPIGKDDSDKGNIAQRERDRAALKQEKAGVMIRSWLYPRLLPVQAAEPDMRLLGDKVSRIVAVYKLANDPLRGPVVAARPAMRNPWLQKAEDYAVAFYN